MLSAIRSLIELFVKHHILANILIAMTLMGGIVAFYSTKKSFFPTTKMNSITIQVVYPGASPEEMEEGVTQKIEEAIYNIAGIDEITSVSSENTVSINVLTLETYDIDEVYQELKNNVDGINSFPVSAEKPIITKVKPRSPALTLGLTGDVSLYTFKRTADNIRDEMISEGVVSQVSNRGYNQLEISIEVPENTLRKYNLTFDQVANAVRQNNRDISAGSIKSTEEEILIRSRAKEKDPEMIGEIVLRSNEDGTKLLLRDIANIREQFTDDTNKSTLNGEQAVFININRLEEEDLEAISEYVADYVERFNARNDVMKLSVNFNFMDFLQNRLDILTSNGMVGLILVLLSLGLFLSIRLSFWVAWGIPSSFLGMFIIGAFYGLTINIMSLFGMIMVIGILVDDGIVIAENIFTHFEKTKNPIKAAINGTMEVLPAVLTSVTTTIVAFLPLFFLTGRMEFMKDMAFVVVASLIFSLIEAFFILPAHLSSKKVLSVKAEDTRSFRIRSYINKGLEYIKNNIYGKALTYTMKYRFLSACFVFAVFPLIFGLIQGGFIKSTFFPPLPHSNFQVNISFKPGVTEQTTEKYIARIEDLIWVVNNDLKSEFKDSVDFIRFTVSSVGSNQGSGADVGSHAGGINVFFKELDGTGVSSYDIINRIRGKVGPIPEAEKFLIGASNRFGSPVAVRLMGNNYKDLELAKEYFKEELAKIPALKDIQDNEKVGRREMLFELKPEAYFLGLTHNDITSQIRQGFFGEEVQRLQKGKDEVRVWVRYPKEDRVNQGQLETMKIKTSVGGSYPLTQVADYEMERGVSSISHFDGKRAITIEADMVDPFGEVPPILSEIQANIVPELQIRFPSVTVDYGGQSEASTKAQKEILLYFVGAFILIFIIVMINFRSFYQALMIIMMIPLGWIGAVAGHGFEDKPLSLISMWGMIALSGVIINDAVVFLSKYNQLIEEGHNPVDAAYRAGLARFRAIMLTTVTTVAGLWPLILVNSLSAQMLIPMAISVAYGVLIGTFFILMFFPVLILLFNDLRRYGNWIWTGIMPNSIEVERAYIDEKKRAAYAEDESVVSE